MMMSEPIVARRGNGTNEQAESPGCRKGSGWGMSLTKLAGRGLQLLERPATTCQSELLDAVHTCHFTFLSYSVSK